MGWWCYVVSIQGHKWRGHGRQRGKWGTRATPLAHRPGTHPHASHMPCVPRRIRRAAAEAHVLQPGRRGMRHAGVDSCAGSPQSSPQAPRPPSLLAPKLPPGPGSDPSQSITTARPHPRCPHFLECCWAWASPTVDFAARPSCWHPCCAYAPADWKGSSGFEGKGCNEVEVEAAMPKRSSDVEKIGVAKRKQ